MIHPRWTYTARFVGGPLKDIAQIGIHAAKGRDPMKDVRAPWNIGGVRDWDAFTKMWNEWINSKYGTNSINRPGI